jgi:Mg2+ and Co2+ transporter CorA
VPLPDFPGAGTADFWWVCAVMIAISLAMLWFFRRRRWL